MNHFNYKDQILFAENVDLRRIASEVGTPCFVYSCATLERHWQAFDEVFKDQDHLVCYAVKANSNLAVLNILARMGSGFDIVSGGELERVLRAGGDPQKIVFSGIGKTRTEMQRALEVGIYCFNVESVPELKALNEVAGLESKIAHVSIRVNPDVDAGTHPYISTGLKENKFGIEFEQAFSVYELAASLPNIEVTGIDCHIGSQLSEIRPIVDALHRMLVLVDKLQAANIPLTHIDVGGGLGITYNDEQPPSPAEYASAILAKLKDRDLKIIMEPGRAIVGNAGILLTQVNYLKMSEYKNFAIVDAAMNDLIRPSLYQAWQNIIPIDKRQIAPTAVYDIVGPVCEAGDFLGKDRELSLQENDLLAVCGAGAYGFVMSSNYNTRPRAAEVLVVDDEIHVIRKRETLDDLLAGEHILLEE